MKSPLWFFGLVAASVLLTGCPEKRRPAGSAAPKSAPARSPEGEKPPAAQGPLADYARTLDKSEKKAAEVTGLTLLNQAVQQFNVVEGRFPRTIDELVTSRYLDRMPVAPRGKRYIYNPKSGEVTAEALAPSAEATPAAGAPEPTPTE